MDPFHCFGICPKARLFYVRWWVVAGVGGRQGDRSGRLRDGILQQGALSVWLKEKQKEHRLKPGGPCAQTLHHRLSFVKEPLVSPRSCVLFCTEETTDANPSVSTRLLVLSDSPRRYQPGMTLPGGLILAHRWSNLSLGATVKRSCRCS